MGVTIISKYPKKRWSRWREGKVKRFVNSRERVNWKVSASGRRGRQIWGACPTSWSHRNTWAATEGYVCIYGSLYLSEVLCSYLCSKLPRNKIQMSMAATWDHVDICPGAILPLEVMVMSWPRLTKRPYFGIFVTTKGHTDVLGLGCCLRPCWWPNTVLSLLCPSLAVGKLVLPLPSSILWKAGIGIWCAVVWGGSAAP